MNAPSRAARRALHLLTRCLPRGVRDAYEEEWATELAQTRRVPLKLLELALAVPRMAIEEHTGNLEPVAVRRSDRALFAVSRGLMLAFVLFTMVADLVSLYMATAHGADLAWLKIAVFNLLLLGYWQVVHRGAYWDWPWLRATRLASLVKLLWLGLPLLLVLSGALPDDWKRLWAVSLIVYLPWETYWNVRRPYRRPGPLNFK